MTHDELRDCPFAKSIFSAVPVILVEHDQQHGCKSECILDKHDFYILRVGNRLAALLYHCEQLAHAILFISNYRQTPITLRAGISRAKHLRYAIESYIVRTQTLYDLVLKLVDAVFNLTNTDSQCRHSTIVQNLKVKQTEIPMHLEHLQKKLSDFRDARHTIIHRGAYQEEELYQLELYSELEESYKRSGDLIPNNLLFLPKAKQEMTRELIKKQKAQYSRFNASAFQLVSVILDNLLDRFIQEEYRLRPASQESTPQDKSNGRCPSC